MPGKIGYFIVCGRYRCRIDVSIVALIEQGSMGGDVCYGTLHGVSRLLNCQGMQITV
jgi:hypothetical protein